MLSSPRRVVRKECVDDVNRMADWLVGLQWETAKKIKSWASVLIACIPFYCYCHGRPRDDDAILFSIFSTCKTLLFRRFFLSISIFFSFFIWNYWNASTQSQRIWGRVEQYNACFFYSIVFWWKITDIVLSLTLISIAPSVCVAFKDFDPLFFSYQRLWMKRKNLMCNLLIDYIY